MSYILLENGNIRRLASVYDPATKFHFSVPQEIEPDSSDYMQAARWLSHEDAERARAIHANYRALHSQASQGQTILIVSPSTRAASGLS